MDNTEQMRQVAQDLAAMANKIEQLGNVPVLFELVLGEGRQWERGMMFGALKAYLGTAEFALRRAAGHLDYELRHQASLAVAEGDGA